MTVLGSVLLATSLISLAVYLVSAYRLLSQPHHRGLVRTALCRVMAACLYTVIAVATLSGHRSSAAISVGVFVLIQLMWQANVAADVLLTNRENKARRAEKLAEIKDGRVVVNEGHRLPTKSLDREITSRSRRIDPTIRQDG